MYERRTGKPNSILTDINIRFPMGLLAKEDAAAIVYFYRMSRADGRTDRRTGRGTQPRDAGYNGGSLEGRAGGGDKNRYEYAFFNRCSRNLLAKSTRAAAAQRCSATPPSRVAQFDQKDEHLDAAPLSLHRIPDGTDATRRRRRRSALPTRMFHRCSFTKIIHPLMKSATSAAAVGNGFERPPSAPRRCTVAATAAGSRR